MMALTCLQVWTEGLKVRDARDRPWHRSEAKANRDRARRGQTMSAGRWTRADRQGPVPTLRASLSQAARQVSS